MTAAESIRPLLNSRDPRAVDGAVETATAYLAQCAAINQRLARCADYLRRGLRSEAVHLAECHPNVLRSVEDLQPTDPHELESLFTQLGMTAPEQPNAAVIADLRTARETELSLSSLLAQHRTLSVGQGPVRQRLTVLYALAQKDPTSPTWPSEIRQLEAERLKGIEREYKIAIRKSDLAALDELGWEVSQSYWLNPLPSDLVQRIQDSAQTVRRDAKIVTLKELIDQLQSAREDGDQIECAKLLDRWQTETTTPEARSLDLPADLIANGAETVQGIGMWLTTERRRRFEIQRNAANASYGSENAASLLLKRGIAAAVATLRRLIPQRFRSLPPEPDPAPRFLRGNSGMNHIV